MLNVNEQVLPSSLSTLTRCWYWLAPASQVDAYSVIEGIAGRIAWIAWAVVHLFKQDVLFVQTGNGGAPH
jgi:hypothetical protein